MSSFYFQAGLQVPWAGRQSGESGGLQGGNWWRSLDVPLLKKVRNWFPLLPVRDSERECHEHRGHVAAEVVGFPFFLWTKKL